MKTKLTATLGLLLSFSAFAYVNIQDTSQSALYDFAVDTIRVEETLLDGQAFNKVSLVGVNGFEAIDYELGNAEIPVLRFEVSAESANDIQIISRELKSSFDADVQGIVPVLESLEKVPGSYYSFPKSIAQKNLAPYEIKEIGSVAGVKRFFVTLRPLELSGTSLRNARSFSVEVKKATVNNFETKGLVFIVGEKFQDSASLAGYVALKQAAGLEVHQLNVKNGQDPDAIRAELRALYAQKPNLKYALIIGDAEDVPGLSSNLIAGTTDLYYAAIDTDDYSTDILTPDLQVGRISATSEAELAKIFLKYTRYVKGEFSSLSWVERISFLATDDRWTVAEGTHNYVIDTYTKDQGYLGSFPDARNAGGDKLYAITHRAGNAEVMKSFFEGRSIIDYSGHGATTYWDAPRVTQDDVRSMTHSSLPFVISNSCITGEFTAPESFAETWQRHEWGAIMFWGSMDSTYWDEDDILEKRMFDGIFVNKFTTFGDITEFALKEMAKFYNGAGRSQYYFETYHMFGDPSVNLKLK